MTIGERLKELRDRQKWSVAYVADKLKIAKSTYAGYEYGRRNVPSEILPKIASLYHVSIDYILGITEDPTPPTLHDIEDIAGSDNEDIAKQMKKLGATVIKLNEDLLDRGVTREELEEMLRMMLRLKGQDGSPPSE